MSIPQRGLPLSDFIHSRHLLCRPQFTLQRRPALFLNYGAQVYILSSTSGSMGTDRYSKNSHAYVSGDNFQQVRGAKMKLIWGMVLMTLTATTALAHGGGVTYYSSADLHGMAQKLERQQSQRTTGIAAETLEKYPAHFTMLTVRTASGGAEEHAHDADIFFIVDGEATLTTGGTIVDPETVSPGEIRGKKVEGGVERKLGKGDVVHIAPNTPHQMILAKGHSLAYFVVKVHE